MVSTVTKMIDGNELDIDAAFNQYSQLIHKVCQRFRKQLNAKGMEYDDLFNIASIGFIKAFERFAPERFDVRFSTYAVPMMEGEIRRVFRDTYTGAKFPRSTKETAWEIKKNELESSSPEVIAETLDISLKTAKGALQYIQNSIPDSIHRQVFESDGSAVTLEDMVSTDEDFTNAVVQEFVDSLDEREKRLVQGLLEGKTQKEIGELIGCSQVHVSRLLNKVRAHYTEFSEEGEKEIMTLTVERYKELKEQGRTDREIAEMVGTDHNGIYNFKKENGLVNKRTASVESAEKEAPATQYAQLMDELKQQLAQKTDLADKLQEKITHFETGVEQYKQALAEERLKYKALEEAFEDVEAENEKLRRELEQQATDEHLSDENKRLQIGYEALKQALKVVL